MIGSRDFANYFRDAMLPQQAKRPGRGKGAGGLFRTGGAIILAGLVFGAWGCGLGEVQAERQAVTSANRELYQVYREYRQSQNLQRERAGLPPLTIKPYEEWKQAPGLD